jgi:hypothetical protein
VGDTEPGVSHPLPRQKKTNVNKYQSNYDEGYEQYMRDKYCISGKRIQRTGVDGAS